VQLWEGIDDQTTELADKQPDFGLISLLYSASKRQAEIESMKVKIERFRPEVEEEYQIREALLNELADLFYMQPEHSISAIEPLCRVDDITRCASGIRRLPDDHIDALITSALEQCPCHSLSTLCSAIKHPSRTVWRHLHCAGFVVHNLRLVPHEPSFSKSGTSWNGNRIVTNTSIRQTSHLAVFSDRG
jgi:hypothetical protein